MKQSGGRPTFPKHLEFWRERIEQLAKRCGLDFNPVIFEMVSEEEMSAIAAYVGYPSRYHHWSWGQDFIISKREHRWGLSKIYELVIPTNPVYAYLVTTNTTVAQKLVMAHVFAHADFFKNNVWCQGIPADLHERFAENAERVDAIRHEIGREKVDEFLEACLSIANLFNPLEPFTLQTQQVGEEVETEPKRLVSADTLPGYMQDALNPREWIEAQRKKLQEEAELQSKIDLGIKIPAKPVRDVLGFILLHAPLEPWQQHIMRIIREETVAFKGIAQTKIMNEGWAAYWHGRIMGNMGVATDGEIFSFTRLDSGLLGSRGLNPYRLGMQLWRHIKWCWDTGRHGAIWDECTDADIRNRWEEFMVFKVLFDRYGGLTDKCLQSWAEFTTLVHETQEGRGLVRPAFFCDENKISEWLHYLRTEAQNKEWDQIPVKLLSERSVKIEIECAKWYAAFKKKLRSGEVPLYRVAIKENWLEWARQQEFVGKLGEGLEKMFKVRTTHNDVAFIEDFFTDDFCREHKYHTVRIEDDWEGPRYKRGTSKSRQIKRFLLNQLINLHNPQVMIYDANFNNNGELRLIHLADGRNLNLEREELEEVMSRLYQIWGKGKPLHLETMVLRWKKIRPWYETYPEKPQLEPPQWQWARYTYDGKDLSGQQIPFEKLEKDIKKMLFYLPSNAEYIE